MDTIVFIEYYPHTDEADGVGFGGGTAFLHSTAALMIAKDLGFPWSLGLVFVLVPTPIRDWFYKLFAKYRYRLFGKKDVCMIPTPDVRERFIV